MRRTLLKQNYDHTHLIPLLTKYNHCCPLCHKKLNEKYDKANFKANMNVGHIFQDKKYPELACDTNNMIPICFECNRDMWYKETIYEYCVRKNLVIPEEVKSYVEKVKIK